MGQILKTVKAVKTIKAVRAVKRKTKEPDLKSEFSYASHHHLIPLYILSGVAILAILVTACFVSILWQTNQRDSYRPAADLAITVLEQQYLPTSISPVEKKQYVYSANLRFPVTNPYTALRYSYDPGVQATKTSATITLTTSQNLQALEAPLLNDPSHSIAYVPRLQQCNRLYVIRFVAGVTPFGGFTPLKDVKLKDGRTAYIHKNTDCVPESAQAMSALESVENDIVAVESY